MAINLAKQLLGTARGEGVEKAEDSVLDPIAAPIEKLVEDGVGAAVSAYLTANGEPGTVDGLVDLIDKKIDAIISGLSVDAAFKADLIAAFNAIETKVIASVPNDTI